MIAAIRRQVRPMLDLALPLVLAEVGWMCMGIVDTIMVGRLPNSAVAIGAVSLGGALYYTTAIFGSGLLLGLDTLVAHAFGRDDLDDANRSLIASLWLALALTPALMTVIWMWTPVMRRFGVAPDVVREMGPFLNALNWGTLPLLVYFAARRYLQAVNIVKPVTFALISANIVNLVANWVLIYGHWGAKAYGVPGSGWSTLMARLWMAGVLAVTLLVANRGNRLRLSSVSPRPDAARMRRLMALGGPAATQILLEAGVFSAATALAGKLGPMALAGHQIALNCASFTFMVPLGISSAAAVRVGQNLGRGDPRTAREAGWTAIALGAGFMGAMALLFVSAPRLIARVFSPDPAVVRTGAALLLIAAVFQLFDGMQVVATGTLRGLGDTRTPMLANLAAYWVIGLPLGWVLTFKMGWGAAGLWTGLCIGLILVGSVLVLAWETKIKAESAVSAARSAV
ncbi:MAG TPA: MATE family efflux transporter [Terriglobales bacterium]|nr:MATE family efflux transporter [Terriglobales bacterium]